MKRKTVKFMCYALVLIVFAMSMPIPAFAVEDAESQVPNPLFVINGQEVTLYEIAEKAHYDVDELYAYYLENPDEFIRQVTKLYETKLQTYSTGNTAGTAVDSLTELVAQGKKGDILISATNTTLLIGVIPFRHGHAAIVYDYETIVQAVAPGYDSVKTTLNNFGASTKVRLYEVANANKDQAAKAADYAATNLVGKPYARTPAADSTTELNCATLVWQAYKSQGFTLNKYLGTVTPQSLVEDTQTDAIGYINWSGDQDSFDA